MTLKSHIATLLYIENVFNFFARLQKMSYVFHAYLAFVTFFLTRTAKVIYIIQVSFVVNSSKLTKYT